MRGAARPVPAGLSGPGAAVAAVGVGFRYNGASQDFRDLIVRAQIVDIAGKCEWGDKDVNTVVATVQVVVDAARGPAMTGDAIGSATVFIAVTDGNDVRDEKRFYLPVVFDHNIDTASAVSKGVRMELPVTPQSSAAAYGLVAGFQLAPRRRSPRGAATYPR